MVLIVSVVPWCPVSTLLPAQCFDVFEGVDEGHNTVPISTIQPDPNCLIEENIFVLLHGSLQGHLIVEIYTWSPSFVDRFHLKGMLIEIEVLNSTIIIGALDNIFEGRTGQQIFVSFHLFHL